MAKLLIVEVDPALLTGLAQLFGLVGHDVRAVASGEAALETLNANIPDLIVSDIVLTGMSGLQLLDEVRAHPQWHSIPFLFINASVLPETEAQIAACDGVSYVRKPFEIDELLTVLRAALSTRSEAERRISPHLGCG